MLARAKRLEGLEVLRLARNRIGPTALTALLDAPQFRSLRELDVAGNPVRAAMRARLGELGIIPGSMGARSFIVSGRGEPQSFESCSHGAGRAMSRGEARRRFSIEDHVRATRGVECRTDAGVLDETPKAYKPIDAVMRAQRDLVDVVHELRQVVCVKG